MPVVRGKNIETLFSAEEIAARNLALASEIAARPQHDMLVISILKGSFIFAADLIRALHAAGLAPEVEFITLSSYGKGTLSQGVKIIKDIDSDVERAGRAADRRYPRIRQYAALRPGPDAGARGGKRFDRRAARQALETERDARRRFRRVRVPGLFRRRLRDGCLLRLSRTALRRYRRPATHRPAFTRHKPIPCSIWHGLKGGRSRTGAPVRSRWTGCRRSGRPT